METDMNHSVFIDFKQTSTQREYNNTQLQKYMK